MTVKTSFYKARDEVKKVFKEKKLSPNFANVILALIVAVFDWLKKIFFKIYLFIFRNLNKVLPLPFVSIDDTDSKTKIKFNINLLSNTKTKTKTKTDKNTKATKETKLPKETK